MDETTSKTGCNSLSVVKSINSVQYNTVLSEIET